MNQRSCKEVLTKKINAWIKSITDEKLKELCIRDTVVTGGCISSLLQGEKVNDYDIYFKTQETTYEVAQYYFDKIKCVKHPVDKVKKLDDRVHIYIKSCGFLKDTNVKVKKTNEDDLLIYEEEDKNQFIPIFITSNAITLSNKIQIVTRFYGKIHEIHENFDFIHCTSYFDFKEKYLSLPQSALLSILTKQLYYSGSKYPLCSIFRLRKFIKRDWKITAGEILKIAFQLSRLDLTKIDVLEEQLLGVDTTYFAMLIKKLREEERVTVDYDYVCELIDKIFN